MKMIYQMKKLNWDVGVIGSTRGCGPLRESGSTPARPSHNKGI